MVAENKALDSVTRHAAADGSLSNLKAIASAHFRALVEGDADTLLRLTDPKCRFFVPGDKAQWIGMADYLGGSISAMAKLQQLRGPITMLVGEMIAEGDRVWFEAESRSQLSNGHLYNNFYLFQYRIADGRVVEIKDSSDTLHVWKALGLPLDTDERRESPLTYVTTTIVGD